MDERATTTDTIAAIQSVRNRHNRDSVEEEYRDEGLSREREVKQKGVVNK